MSPSSDAFSFMIATLGEFFARRSVPAYLVGGSVRDCLLGRASDDVDITVRGPALELAKEVAESLDGSYVAMDEANQIARVVFRRKEQGAELHVDICAMHGSIGEDLADRDFTVNAMAVRLEKPEETLNAGDIIDPFDGRGDIASGIIRMVSEVNLAQDPLRLLRAIRLAAELGFEIESATSASIHRHSRLISTVSAERIRDEFYRVVSACNTAQWLSCTDGLGLLTAIIPEMEALKNVAQPREHYWDVFRHSLETVATIEYLLDRTRPHGLWQFGNELLAPVPWTDTLDSHFHQEVSSGRKRGGLLKLIAFLHDVGKPRCKTIEESGRIRFLGHAADGALIASRVMERLRFSAREVALASVAIAHHLRPGSWGEEPPSDRAIYRFFRDTGDTGIDVIFLNLADHLATRGPLLTMPEWERHGQVAGRVLARFLDERSVVSPSGLLNGHLLMQHLNLAAGPLIGRLLESIREAQAAGEVKTQEEAFALARTLLPLDSASRVAEVASSHTA